MEFSPVAELIKALSDFEKRLDEIKKELIKSSTSKLISKAESFSAEIDRYSEETLLKILDDFHRELEKEKERVKEEKEKEKEEVFEKMRLQVEANLNRVIEEIFSEAKRLLGL